MSNIVDVILCPFHNEQHPSCTIYDNNTYYCFGCKKFGIADTIYYVNGIGMVRKTKLQPKGLNLDEWGMSYSKAAQHWAFKRGVLTVNLSRYNVLGRLGGDDLLFPCYDFDGKVIGYQVRYIPGNTIKTKLYPKDGTYPAYSAFCDAAAFNKLVIVESIVDGMSLHNHVRLAFFIALLGTKMHPSVIHYAAMCHVPVYVYFDPDARLRAAETSHRLLLHGIEAHTVLSDKKPYEILKQELRSLIP